MGRAISEAFLLCGGGAERLGFPKEMLRVDGRPLALAMVQKLQRHFPTVGVVTNRPAYLQHLLDAPLHRDVYPGRGPLAGIHTGLGAAGSEAAFFLGCDMPLVPDELIARLAAAARQADPALVARTPGGREPLCGVYRRKLLPALEARLEAGRDLGAGAFLEAVGAREMEVTPAEAAGLRDVDAPEDLPLLREAFGEVEPLPVRRCAVKRLGGEPIEEDLVVEERAFALHVNAAPLLSLQCLPNALRELAVGFLASLGVIEGPADVRRLEPDYEAGRVVVEVTAGQADLREAARMHAHSVGAAGVDGPLLAASSGAKGGQGFRVGAAHLLDVLGRLRQMAPVFERTGATHQAAFTDGARVVHFFEDVGRHNALDKVIGAALMAGTPLGRGALVATGRINAEMAAKALRRGVPVMASGSAPTTRAVRLAADGGLALVGFARGRRLNIYTHPDRIAEEAEPPEASGP
jgi:FdhD protein